jgi:hypothetical protein
MSLTKADAAYWNTDTGAVIAKEVFARYLLGSSIIGWLVNVAAWGSTCTPLFRPRVAADPATLSSVCIGWAAVYMRSDLWKRDTRGRRALLVFVLTIATWQAWYVLRLTPSPSKLTRVPSDSANAFLSFHWATVQTRDAVTMMKPSMLLSPVSSFVAQHAYFLFLAHLPFFSFTQASSTRYSQFRCCSPVSQYRHG